MSAELHTLRLTLADGSVGIYRRGPMSPRHWQLVQKLPPPSLFGRIKHAFAEFDFLECALVHKPFRLGLGLAVFLAALWAGSAFGATSVTSHNITWTFDTNYTVGQYVTGDYYVVAPGGLSITAITGANSASAVVTGTGYARVKNGTIINPNGSTGSSHGVDSWYKQNDVPNSYYSTSLNKARPVRDSGSDLVVGSTTTQVSSATHVFDAADVGNAVIITGSGTGLTRGTYRVASVAAGVATLDRSAGTVGASGGSWVVDSELSVSNPLVVAASSSVISTLSNSDRTIRPTLTDTSILTVVASAPAANSFRPGYCGTDKTAYWTKASLNYSKLRSLSPVTGTPSLSTSENRFQYPWLDYITNNDGRDMHPSNNMPDYGGDMSDYVGCAILQLQLDYSNATKETLLVRLVQFGIDIYSIVSTGGNWEGNGGHHQGRKPALVLAAEVLGDTGMQAWANKALHNWAAEDKQTFYVDAAQLLVVPYNGDGRLRTSYATKTSTVTITNASPTVISWPAHGLGVMQWVEFTTTGTLPSPIALNTKYWVSATNLLTNSFCVSLAPGGALLNTTTSGSGTHTATFYTLGLPEWGEKHDTTKTRDGSNWGAYYRDLNYRPWAGTILGISLLGSGTGQTTWNNDVVFDYMLRVRSIKASEATFGAFYNNMWLTYGTASSAVTVPAAPSDLVVTVLAPGRLGFTWTDNATDETYYQISRATSSGGTYTVIATLDANTTSWTYENTPPNVLYYFKTRAYNPVGGSATYSNIVSATAPEPPTINRRRGSAASTRGSGL